MDTTEPGGVLPQLRLDELLGELQARLQAVLEAVVAVGSGLELETMLRRIVEPAIDLVDATSRLRSKRHRCLTN